MRIAVRSNVALAGLLQQGSVELQEGGSMRSLLALVSEQCHLNMMDPKTGRMNGSDFTILLNGKEHLFWPQGLDTRLRNADEVQILLMPLGGG
jgi:hypothetical protein